MKTLKFANLSIISSDNETILENVNYRMESNIIYGLYGKGGAGKSTLAYAISGIIPHFLHYIKEGEVLIDTSEINDIKKDQLGRHIGIVFQNPDYQLFFHKVNMELQNSNNNFTGLLKNLKIQHLLDRQVDTLSYGEKKIVILLSNILLSPDIIILDEVFSSLDEYYTKLIMEFLVIWINNERMVIILENEREKLPQNVKTINFKDILNGS